VEVLNDLDGELINFWRVIQNHADEFLRWCHRLVPSREIFEAERYRGTDGLTDIQRAARYFYLQRLAFGGDMKALNLGTSSVRPPAFHLAELADSLPKVQKRLQRVLIECLYACECLRRYDRATTFFYLDPPYWGSPKYRWSFSSDQDYEQLAAILSKIKGKFLLTLNDCDSTRRIFSEFTIETAKCGYFIANTRNATNARPMQSQLFIHNMANR